MTTAKKLPAVAPGDQIHWLRDGFSYSVRDDWGAGEVSRRGQTVTVTREMVLANSDTAGASFFDLIDKPDSQLERWGFVYLGRGEFPATEPLHVRGTPEWERARENARLAAWAVPDETERATALKAVVKDFGPAPSFQQTVEYRGSTTVPAREQA